MYELACSDCLLNNAPEFTQPEDLPHRTGRGFHGRVAGLVCHAPVYSDTNLTR